jgi:hypothetical protein
MVTNIPRPIPSISYEAMNGNNTVVISAKYLNNRWGSFGIKLFYPNESEIHKAFSVKLSNFQENTN